MKLKAFFEEREQQIIYLFFGFIAGFFACLLFLTALKLSIT